MLNQLKGTWIVPLLLLSLILISHIPLPFITPPAKPNLVLIIIFYFSIMVENRLPYPILFTILFLLGLVEDFLGHNLIGISSLLYVVTAMIATGNHKALSKQKFLIVWIAFIITVFLIKIIELTALSFYTESNYFHMLAFFDALLTILLYPSLHLLFTKNLNCFRSKYNAR